MQCIDFHVHKKEELNEQFFLFFLHITTLPTDAFVAFYALAAFANPQNPLIWALMPHIGHNALMTNFHQWFLWQPDARMRHVVFAASAGLTLFVGWAHHRFGLAYEFHMFFGVPVLVTVWYLGWRHGLALAIAATGLWYLADHLLVGDTAEHWPLLFNTAMRLVLFISGAWLIVQLRRVLDLEVHLAREDALTGLTNRRSFHERGRDALALSNRQNAAFTVVFIDLDKFKEVNDTFGHETGDALLRLVAETLRAHMRVSDIVGRFGGDEFALLLPGMDAAGALVYVDTLRHHLLAAMQTRNWPVTFSMGVASYRHAPRDFDAIIKQADALMYAAKDSGRDRIMQATFDGGTA